MARTLSSTIVHLILEMLDYDFEFDTGAEYATKIGYHELLADDPRGYREEPDTDDETCAYSDRLRGSETPLGCHTVHHETPEYAIYYNAYEYKEI